MVKYLSLNNIKQYYKNGSFYICGIGNVYGRWNDMLYFIFRNYIQSLIHRRTFIWFFKALFNSYYWCEFEHYYYMERFMTKKEVKELKEKFKKA